MLEYYGMWVKDSDPHELLGERFWLTKHIGRKTLYYYNNLENVKNDKPDGSYELTELYASTDNVVYNGSFYYHRAGGNEIIRFDLVNNETAAKVEIPDAAYQASGNSLFVISAIIFYRRVRSVVFEQSHFTYGLSPKMHLKYTVSEKNCAKLLLS